MKNALLVYLSSLTDFSEQELLAIEESMEIITFKKGEYLLKEGQKANNCYFVLQGCVRQFVMKDGDEKTNQFYTENDWIVSMDSFLSGAPSKQNWIAVEETEVVVGSQEKEDSLFSKFPQFQSTARIVIEKMLAGQQGNHELNSLLSPEEKYLYLLEETPDLLQRVPQHHIASYIGIKPESLSRIKKRMISHSLIKKLEINE